MPDEAASPGEMNDAPAEDESTKENKPEESNQETSAKMADKPTMVAAPAKTQPISRNKLPPGYIFLWIITLISLLINVILIRSLLEVRSLAGEALADAALILDSFRGETLTYTFELQDTLNIQTEIPVNETIPVEINESIPISTVVNVPINTPLGSTSANVPINTTVPLDLDIEVPLEQTFQVQAAVPIDLAVPIELSIDDTPLGPTLDDIIINMNAIADSLNSPLLGGSGSTEGASE